MKKIVLLACILLIPSFVFAGIFDKVKSVAGSVVSVVTGTTDPYQLSEEEFKEQCEKIEYEDLLRKAEENKGKFTETMKRTGKSAEELSHSKNPVTRKRAIFALNARK